ncbi:MAG TPA: hypothetical protein VK835_11450 [Bacteroidia bacterium]|jgi:hypothetical protein|nr:hypothetical protein [Bacteroidia bacterium]
MLIKLKIKFVSLFVLLIGFSAYAQTDSSSSIISDTSTSKSLTDNKSSADTSKLASDSSKHKSVLNKIMPTVLVPDSSKRKKLLHKIVHPGIKKPFNDTTVKQKLRDKIALPDTKKIIPDSSAKKKLLNKIIPQGHIKLLPDSSARKKVLKKIIPETYGNISAGYDYGVIPFAANANYPMGYYSSQGNIGVTTLGLPLVVSYYYSSLKSVAGLNNYFKVSFDASHFKETIKNKGLDKVDEETKKLSFLSNLKQSILQKIAYYEHLKNGLPNESAMTDNLTKYKNGYNSVNSDSLTKPKLPSIGLNDSSLTKALKDSLAKLTNLNSIKKSAYADSIKTAVSHLHKSDSTNEQISQYKKQIDKIEAEIKSIKNKLAYFQNPQNVAENNPYLSKAQGFLAGIKKADIGLCYPNYSTFLVSGTTLKGINFEWQKNIFYFAVTYGKTINTLLTTNNIIQNQLQTGRNLYNFFDFNNVKDSRKIGAFKFGLGKKESSHLFVGALEGVGLPSYLVAPLPNGSIEKNIVLEVDGKVAFNASNSIDVVYGKSVLYQKGILENPEISPFQSLFSKFRSNAALVRFNSDIKKTKTKITLTGRIIDPFFNSYGVGFQRSDNLRYEIKVDQVISSKVKFTGFYRRDRDNLLGTSIYTTNLQTMGANLLVKINKNFTARVSYTPAIQKITSKDSAANNSHHLNNIGTVVLTYNLRVQKISSFFNALYNTYQLSSATGKNTNFQNLTISNSTIFNKQIKATMTLNYFYNNDSDTLNNNTLMVSGNFSYTLKNSGMLTVGATYATNHNIKNQAGGLIKLNIPLINHFRLEFEVQKLVLGDFYNSYNIAEIKKFPFYGYSKVIVTW